MRKRATSYQLLESKITYSLTTEALFALESAEAPLGG